MTRGTGDNRSVKLTIVTDDGEKMTIEQIQGPTDHEQIAMMRSQVGKRISLLHDNRIVRGVLLGAEDADFDAGGQDERS